MDIVQLIYRPIELGAFKDFEFSRSTMAARWKQGLSDVLIALQAFRGSHRPKELRVRVFDVMHDLLTGRPELR
jgi:NTE family protein